MKENYQCYSTIFYFELWGKVPRFWYGTVLNEMLCSLRNLPKKEFQREIRRPLLDILVTEKTLWSVHFGVVVVELINRKCGGIVRNDIW